ncbi:ABC transporter permease [Fibrobacterota bacterium]
MEFLIDGIREAIAILLSFDRNFLDIISVSLKASLLSIILASAAGVPLGIFLALKKFPGRGIMVTVVNSLMSVPTVVIGLLVYSFLSRRGMLGDLGLLYTITAMVIGQSLLAFPIVTGLTVSAVRSLDKRVFPTIVSLGANTGQGLFMVVKEARYAITAAVAAGFARVFAEIGISMMLGGNIKGYTRNITTAIALETAKGEFAAALALGIVLVLIAFAVHLTVNRFQRMAV